MTTKKLIKHVKDSFWLDLAYDEEHRNIIDQKGLASLIKKVSNDGENNRTIPPLPNKKNPELWFNHFKRMKLIRVLDGLGRDEASQKYADSILTSTEEKFQQREFKNVRNSSKQLENNLDKITWKCSAAIDNILGYYEAEDLPVKAAPDAAKNPESQKPSWATLLALYHSELCASASPEVSFGWARRQNFVLKEEAAGFEIFQWIARNNVSRGYNHLDNPLSAIKGFDFYVDTFKCEELAIKLCESGEATQENKSMLYRLLYMPAILILAQSLGDLQRHSERRYYLNKGLEAKKFILEKEAKDYWCQVFALRLSLTESDTGLLPYAHETSDPESMSATYLNDTPPRTRSLSMQKEVQHAELKMSNDFGTSAFTKHLKQWLHCTAWLRHWHSAETKPFLVGLQTTTGSLVDLLKIAKKPTISNDAKGISYKLKLVRMAITYLTETHRFICFLANENKSGFPVKKTMSFKYLLADQQDLKPTNLNIPEIWKTGSHLLECLKALDEVIEDLKVRRTPKVKKLEGWGKKLENALNWPIQAGVENSLERQFRSEIEHLKLFYQPTKRICQQQNKMNCNDNCFQKVMNEMNDTFTDIKVAKLQTYKRAMYSQQQRFLDYLKFRTARWKSYRLGEPKVKSPNFELISLRRWNSFSPNLGSRAAASVGGGYLVRLWHKDRYVGIAVDPGYNYLENLFNEGFTIADIDIVVVTHAHPDHTENLTNLFTLLFERNKRMADEETRETDPIYAPIDHRIFLLATEGVFERYQSLLQGTKTYIRDVVVLKAHDNWPGSKAGSNAVRVSVCRDGLCRIELDPGIERAFDDECVALIQAKRAWHDDLTGHDSIGIVVTYREEGKRIGILGDSKYHKDLYNDYKDCSVLIAHLGSLVSKSFYKPGEEKSFFKPGDGEKIIKKEGHLYLPGLTRLICDLKIRNGDNEFPLMVLSEFGEELRGGLRKDLAVRLAHGVQNEPLPIVPADVGLRIDIEKQEIYCSVCHRYFAWKGISAESVMPHEEALAFVCEDCRLLRAGELPMLLEDWCTTGRPVIPLNRESTESQ